MTLASVLKAIDGLERANGDPCATGVCYDGVGFSERVPNVPCIFSYDEIPPPLIGRDTFSAYHLQCKAMHYLLTTRLYHINLFCFKMQMWGMKCTFTFHLFTFSLFFTFHMGKRWRVGLSIVLSVD